MSGKLARAIISIGRKAYEILGCRETARVMGITSRGVFLMTGSLEVLFISPEKYRGPLTINIAGPPGDGVTDEGNTRLNLSPDGIKLNGQAVISLTSQSEIWSPPQFPIPATIFPETARRWEEAYTSLKGRAESNSLAVQWINEIRGKSHQELLEFFHTVIGTGSGLTPAGDDFIAGFLLIHSMASQAGLMPAMDAQAVQDLIQFAKKSTTALSANLIALAHERLADERLIRCARWLLAGEDRFEEIKKELRTYGSSSGFDSLAGMLTCQGNIPRLFDQRKTSP